MPTLDIAKKSGATATSTSTAVRAPQIFVIPPTPDVWCTIYLPTVSNEPSSLPSSIQSSQPPNPTASVDPTSTSTSPDPDPDPDPEFDPKSAEGISLLLETIAKLRAQKKKDEERIKKLQEDAKKNVEEKNRIRHELHIEQYVMLFESVIIRLRVYRYF